jgi:hypothetical protein
MEKKVLTYGQAIGIGCVIFIGVSLVAFLLAPDVYFMYALYTFMAAALPLSIIGALIGKFISKTQTGIWLGALLGIILAFLWFISIVSGLVFD